MCLDSIWIMCTAIDALYGQNSPIYIYIYIWGGGSDPLCLSPLWPSILLRLFFSCTPPCQPGWSASPCTCNGLWLHSHIAVFSKGTIGFSLLIKLHSLALHVLAERSCSIFCLGGVAQWPLLTAKGQNIAGSNSDRVSVVENVGFESIHFNRKRVLVLREQFNRKLKHSMSQLSIWRRKQHFAAFYQQHFVAFYVCTAFRYILCHFHVCTYILLQHFASFNWQNFASFY
jgi:hypothetical protein